MQECNFNREKIVKKMVALVNWNDEETTVDDRYMDIIYEDVLFIKTRLKDLPIGFTHFNGEVLTFNNDGRLQVKVLYQ
jgi:hypothetical protein